MLSLLDSVTPHPISGAGQIVRAVPASKGGAKYIEGAHRKPVLRVERVHVGVVRRPAERCVSHCKPIATCIGFSRR